MSTNRRSARRGGPFATPCVPVEDIVAYALGTLTRRGETAFQLHLLTCPDCLEMLGHVRHELADAKRVETLHARKAAVSARRAKVSGLIGRFREVIDQVLAPDGGWLVARPALAAAAHADTWEIPVEVFELGPSRAPHGAPVRHTVGGRPDLEDGRRLYLELSLTRPPARLRNAHVLIVVETRPASGRSHRGWAAARLAAGTLRLQGAPLQRRLPGEAVRMWVLLHREP